MRNLKVAFVVTLLAGCAPSLDELRSEPALWSRQIDAPYDTLTNCIAARMSEDFRSTPQLYPREGKGIVTLTYPGSGFFAEYTVKQLASDRSEVEFKRRKVMADLGGFVAKSQEAAERCRSS